MKRKKTKVRLVSGKKMGQWAGMNSYAARRIGFKHKMKPHEIWIDRNMSKKRIRKTIRHELVERKLMRKGMGYHKAHRIATLSERKVR